MTNKEGLIIKSMRFSMKRMSNLEQVSNDCLFWSFGGMWAMVSKRGVRKRTATGINRMEAGSRDQQIRSKRKSNQINRILCVTATEGGNLASH